MKEQENKDYWFKRRRYGWGWIPVTWQGWLTVTVHLSLFLVLGFMIEDAPQDSLSLELGIFIMGALFLTTNLIRISYKKGPKPRWRWGKSEDDNPEEDF